MEITKYTVELTGDEMFDWAYALEHQIEADLSLTTPIKDDGIFNDFESELKTLQKFVSSFGYKLDVSRKTDCGQFWKSPNETKYYDCTEDWLKALLKQRRKELERAKIKE
jgi:hypothetical protein